MAEIELKIWEGTPMPHQTFRQKLMAFCLENNCAPDEVMIEPYTETAPCGTITETGIRLSYDKPEYLSDMAG